MTLISAHCSETVALDAYQRAAANGGDLVEFDIRRCADGTLVCHHDPTVGESGPPVGDLTYPELCERTGITVPTCADVMSAIAGRALGHLDLKEAGYEDTLIDLADDLLGRDGYVVTTRIDSSIAHITSEYPGVRTALSLGHHVRDVWPQRRLDACGAHGVAMHYRLITAGVLRRCASRGLDVMVWTVNDDAGIDACLRDQRVTVLVTDRAAEAAARRADLGDPM